MTPGPQDLQVQAWRVYHLARLQADLTSLTRDSPPGPTCEAPQKSNVLKLKPERSPK